MKCECGGMILDVDGELVCGTCGIVAGYDMEIPQQTSPTIGLFEYQTGGLATTMGRRYVDHAGRLVTLPDRAKRMMRCNYWTQKYNRSMPVAMAQLSKLRDELKMTDGCSEYAAYLLRRAISSGFMVGRNVSHCTAAAALLACRKHGITRTITDVRKATGLKKHCIFRAYRQMHDLFGTRLPVPDPVSFIARLGGECGIREATRRDALAILVSMDRQEAAGKDPMGLAAAALYFSCIKNGEMVRRRDIAEAAGVAETTLSNRFNALRAVQVDNPRSGRAVLTVPSDRMVGK